MKIFAPTLVGLVGLLEIFTIVTAFCDAPSPAFPLPQLGRQRHKRLTDETERKLHKAITSLADNEIFNATAFSVEVTSTDATLFGLHSTPKVRSSIQKGADVISDTTTYRIASITKAFTVLAILEQAKAGKLDLDDTLLKYIEELAEPQNGTLPWKDITLRALAGQMAGIPRDMAQDDLATDPPAAALLGLPVLGTEGLPQCDSIVNYTRPCNRTDLINWVKKLKPVFAPNQKSSYSNLNYELLGLVLANVTGMSYENYVEKHILRERGMNGASFTTPPDRVAAIPPGFEYYWNFQIGVQNPTGGLYASSSDLSKFLRYTMSTFNAQTHALNWFNPTSFTSSVETYYGMPWEIFRTNKFLAGTSRPVTLVTKSGGLPGYTSNIIMLPEYGIGITILVAGRSQALSILRTAVVNVMIEYGETVALTELQDLYAGFYMDQSTNSSISLGVTEKYGLYVTEWKSNGSNPLALYTEVFGDPRKEYVIYAVPTLLNVDEEHQAGERWRLLPQAVGWKKEFRDEPHSVWDDFCVEDWDIMAYAGRPLNEIVFWGNNATIGKVADRVDLTAFRRSLDRSDPTSTASKIGSEYRQVFLGDW